MVGAVPFDDQEAVLGGGGLEFREQMRERHFRSCLYPLDGSRQASRRLKFPERVASVRGTHDDDNSPGTRFLGSKNGAEQHGQGSNARQGYFPMFIAAEDGGKNDGEK